MSVFDDNNALNNLVKMHKREYDVRAREAEEKKDILMKEREEKAKKKAEDAKLASKKKSSSEPPLNLLITLVGNLKFSIKRIHFRIEDDYYN